MDVIDQETHEMMRDVDALVGAGTSKELALGGAYEGAARDSRELALWHPPVQSADQAILPDKLLLDARTKDVLRNDGYVQSGAQLHRDNIVGHQFMLNAKPAWKTLKLSDAWATEFQQEVEEKFTLAAESDDCWLDATRTNTFTGMVRLAIGINAAAGEVLATAEWLRDTPRPFQTAVQFVDVDRLSTPWTKLNDDQVRGGVEQSKRGAPIAYWIRSAHQNDFNRFARSQTHRRVLARKPWGRPQVIHIKEQGRVDQTRGISDIVAGLRELRTTKKFRDVTLQNAVTNAMFAASIESELPSETVFAQLGAGNIGGTSGAIVDYASSYLGAISEYAGSSRHMQVDGVKIPHLFPGTKLQLRPVGTPGGVGQDFEQSLLRYIASILGVSYEQLSRDWSNTNYSSARAAMVETWKFMMARKKLIADRFANIVYRLWLEEQINTNGLETMRAGRMGTTVPGFYDGLNREAYCRCEWIGAARGQVDELKETQAAILRIKSGLGTHESELGKMGHDWRTIYEQLAREQSLRDSLGIEFFESNAINAASGDTREANEGQSNDSAAA